MHACANCPRKGHGAAGCRFHAVAPKAESWSIPPPPSPPARPTPDEHSRSLQQVFTQSKASSSSASSGFKGYGKGNYGREIAPPEPLPQLSTTAKQEIIEEPHVPPAREPTEEELNQWMSEFEDLSGFSGELVAGEVALWRGFKRGQRGGDSTKTEFFRGHIHAVVGDMVHVS